MLLSASFRNNRPDLKLWRVHNGFFYRALVSHLYECLMVFFRERRRNNNFNNDFFECYFSLFYLAVFKTLTQRNIFCGNRALLAEAEHVYACTCPY